MNAPAFLKQNIMLRVLYALVPVELAAIYFFGWRVVGILLVSCLCAFFTEWYMVSRRKGRVSYACFVTASLYALSLPPTVPLWIVAVGIVVAIIFGKEAFGGFGRNVFNPAIVGRAFVYVCFPVELTSRFVPVFNGTFPGGFAHWSLTSLEEGVHLFTKAGLSVADAVTAATPMWARRDFAHVTDTMNLFIGNIGQVFQYEGQQRILAAGSCGEVSAVVLIIGGVYLLITKTAQWRLVLSTLAGAFFINVLLRYIMEIDGVPQLSFTFFSGALLYAAFFMVTDPVSAPKKPLSQWVYGIFIGMMIVFLRYRSIFAGGVAFSILLGNSLSPSLDMWVKKIRSRKRDRLRTGAEHP
jgi:Na+-transporting NADH:ubiquinone oxidoreductase subunit B